jgi:hypothetical protein
MRDDTRPKSFDSFGFIYGFIIKKAFLHDKKNLENH